jgi:site-specific DNA-methyltransferase (adenine-specific)
MTPYTLHQGDCLEVMQSIEPSSVDLILADLPYGTTQCAWDTVIPFEPLWKEYRRIIKGNAAIVLTSTQPFTTTLISSAKDIFKYCWVWEKSIPGDFFHARTRPMRKHEDVCVFSCGTIGSNSQRRMPYYPQGLTLCSKMKVNDRKTGAFVSSRRPRHEAYLQTHVGYPNSVLKFANDTGHHPTQKPVPLMEYLIRTYTQAGETVLDSCMGSGTTGVAAMNTGRRFIGIELDAAYYAICEKRIIQAHEAQFFTLKQEGI